MSNSTAPTLSPVPVAVLPPPPPPAPSPHSSPMSTKMATYGAIDIQPDDESLKITLPLNRFEDLVVLSVTILVTGYTASGLEHLNWITSIGCTMYIVTSLYKLFIGVYKKKPVYLLEGALLNLCLLGFFAAYFLCYQDDDGKVLIRSTSLIVFFACIIANVLLCLLIGLFILIVTMQHPILADVETAQQTRRTSYSLQTLPGSNQEPPWVQRVESSLERIERSLEEFGRHLERIERSLEEFGRHLERIGRHLERIERPLEGTGRNLEVTQGRPQRQSEQQNSQQQNSQQD